MRKIIFALFACWMAGQAFAADSAWLDSVPQAMDQAKRENKLLLLDFTGSDWCGWCKNSTRKLFPNPSSSNMPGKTWCWSCSIFRDRFTVRRIEGSQPGVANKYQVSGYPTLVLLKPDGTVLWKQTGFLPGGPKTMIAKINQARSKPALRPAKRQPSLRPPSLCRSNGRPRRSGKRATSRGFRASSIPPLILPSYWKAGVVRKAKRWRACGF